jgi:hypothetical protein
VASLAATKSSNESTDPDAPFKTSAAAARSACNRETNSPAVALAATSRRNPSARAAAPPEVTTANAANPTTAASGTATKITNLRVILTATTTAVYGTPWRTSSQWSRRPSPDHETLVPMTRLPAGRPLKKRVGGVHCGYLPSFRALHGPM